MFHHQRKTVRRFSLLIVLALLVGIPLLETFPTAHLLLILFFPAREINGQCPNCNQVLPNLESVSSALHPPPADRDAPSPRQIPDVHL